MTTFIVNSTRLECLLQFHNMKTYIHAGWQGPHKTAGIFGTFVRLPRRDATAISFGQTSTLRRRGPCAGYSPTDAARI
jgi:hypothetical protein